MSQTTKYKIQLIIIVINDSINESMIINDYRPFTSISGCVRPISIDGGPFLQHIARKNYIIVLLYKIKTVNTSNYICNIVVL